jgi:hypothetical protein
MPLVAVVQPLPVDETGIVNTDIPCRGCSYNLRGLSQKARCPECATAVGLSIRGNLLRYCNPDWLMRLWIGSILSTIGVTGLTVLYCLWWPFGVVFRPGQYWIGLMVGIVGALGTWLLTTPDPAGYEPSKVTKARLIARIGLLVALCHSILTLFRNSAVDPRISALMGVGFLIVAAARVSGEIARLVYIHHLALRLPDAKVAARARSLIGWFGGTMAVVTLSSAVFSFVSLTLKQPPMRMGAFYALFTVMRLGSVVLIFAGARYVVMLWELTGALRWQQKEASKLWTSNTASTADTAATQKTPESVQETSSLALDSDGLGGESGR